MPNIRRIRIFAGPNGSGKSSLFEGFSKQYKTGYFVNADNIEKRLADSGLVDLNEMGINASQDDLETFKLLKSSRSLLQMAEDRGHIIDVKVKDNFIVDTSKKTHSYEGAFVASFIRHLLIAQNKSFSFETVMSHKSKIDEIQGIHSLGYQVYLYFVCTDSPGVNISRVNNRVEKGGHKVSNEMITERYSRSLENLHLALPFCFRAYFFDNSGKEQELIAEVYSGRMELKTAELPNWFIDFVLPYYIC